jgi:hypothetical protein
LNAKALELQAKLDDLPDVGAGLPRYRARRSHRRALHRAD